MGVARIGLSAPGNSSSSPRRCDAAERLVLVLLVTCWFTAVPIPFLREWGCLAVVVVILLRNRHLGVPRNVGSIALVGVAVLGLVAALMAAVRLDASWILYEEVPCGLEVLAVSLLSPRVGVRAFAGALSRRARLFSIAAFAVGGIALGMTTAFELLGPYMDQVFTILGSDRPFHQRASLRSDYNCFSVAVLALSAVGLSATLPRNSALQWGSGLMAITVTMMSDSRRAFVYLAAAAPCVLVRRWGWGALGVLVAGVAGALVVWCRLDMPLERLLSPRLLAAVQLTMSSPQELVSTFGRDGLWQWGTESIRGFSSLELLVGRGFDYMLMVPEIHWDPQAPDREFAYVHNVFLGTILSTGLLGFGLLLAALSGAVANIAACGDGLVRSALLLTIGGGIALGMWSGNTILSIPLLAIGLAISLRLRRSGDAGDRQPAHAAPCGRDVVDGAGAAS